MPDDAYRLYQMRRVKGPARCRGLTSKQPGSYPQRYRYFVASRGPCDRSGDTT